MNIEDSEVRIGAEFFFFFCFQLNLSSRARVSPTWSSRRTRLSSTTSNTVVSLNRKFVGNSTDMKSRKMPKKGTIEVPVSLA